MSQFLTLINEENLERYCVFTVIRNRMTLKFSCISHGVTPYINNDIQQYSAQCYVLLAMIYIHLNGCSFHGVTL